METMTLQETKEALKRAIARVVEAILCENENEIIYWSKSIGYWGNEFEKDSIKEKQKEELQEKEELK